MSADAYERFAGGDGGPARSVSRIDPWAEDDDRKRSEYVIQRPAPIPTYIPDDGRQKYPWEQMEPGDMILVQCGPDERDVVQSRLASSGHHWFGVHRPDWRIITARVRKGVRVFLIEREEADDE